MCHGPLATSTKRNKTAEQITNIIQTLAFKSMDPYNLDQLSAEEIQAIADALKDWWVKFTFSYPHLVGSSFFDVYSYPPFSPIKVLKSKTKVQFIYDQGPVWLDST